MRLSLIASAALGMLFGGGGQLSNRNGFVDGTFALWSFGVASPATLTTSSTFAGPAMWHVSAGTGGAGTIQQVDLRGSADLAYMDSEETVTAVKMNITGGSTGTVAARNCAYIYQNIEWASRYAGRSITLQCKLKVDAGTMTIPGLLCAQAFGSGGSPSQTNIFDKAVNWVVGTTFKKFSVRIDVPATSGKTFGTSGGDSFQLGLYLPPGVTGNLTIAEMQVEACSPGASAATDGTGGSPTSYEHRGYAAELLRIQRYYTTLSGLLSGAFVPSAGQGTVSTVSLPVSMRAQPAFGLSNISYNNASGGSVTGNTTAFQLSATVSTASFGSISATVTADCRL